MNFKKIGKVFTSKFVGTGPTSYKKRIYRAAVSQKLRNTDLEDTGADWRLIKKVDLKEVRRVFVDWTNLAEGRRKWRVVVNRTMILRFVQNKINFLTS